MDGPDLLACQERNEIEAAARSIYFGINRLMCEGEIGGDESGDPKLSTVNPDDVNLSTRVNA